MTMFYTTYVDASGRKHYTMARWNCFTQTVEFPTKNF